MATRPIKVRKIELEHKAGSDLIRILANEINASPFGAIKEGISNGYDAESKKVIVDLDTKYLSIEDFGTSILDIRDFSQYGSYQKERESKKAGKGKVVGRYHLGKLSYFKLADTIRFLSNNGSVGYKIEMRLNRVPNFEIEEAEPADSFLNHRGTKITIVNPKIDNLQDFSDRLWHFLSKTFALKTLRKYQLSLNGRAIVANKLEFGVEEVIEKFGKKDQHIITGKVKKGGSGMLRVYCKDIFVANLIVDPERNFTGWVNCDSLTPLVARNEFVEDNTYKEFFSTLKDHVQREFEKRQLELTQAYRSAQNFYEQVIADYLDKFAEPLKAMGSGALEAEKEKREKGEEKGTVEPKDTDRERKPNEKKKKKSGTVSFPIQLGNEKPPLIFKKPNIIYWNVTNDIMRFCLKPYRAATWGSVEIRLMPYFARIFIQMRKEFDSWMYDERLNQIDHAARFIMSYMVSARELITDGEAEQQRQTGEDVGSAISAEV